MIQNTNTSLDFSPLYRHYKLKEIYSTGDTKSVQFSRLMTVIAAIVAAVSVLPIIATIVMIAVSQHSLQFFAIAALSCVLWGLLVWLGLSQAKKHALQNYAARQFAAANAIVFKDYIANPGYPGVLFGRGDTQIIQEAYVFSSNNNLEFGNITVVKGSGDSKDARDFGYAKIPLPRLLPHMVLDSVKNNNMGVSDISSALKGAQKLHLEGDFNSYFTLYAPDQYQQDALYIFTPDVMETLVRYAQNVDLEIIDDRILFRSATKFNLASEADIRFVLHLADVLTAEIGKQSAHYSDDAVGDATKNMLSRRARRLQRGMGRVWATVLGALLVLAVVVAGCLYLRVPTDTLVFWCVFVVVFSVPYILHAARHR